MKSGGSVDNRLIGPGSNNYGTKPEHYTRGKSGEEIAELVKELTPELVDKIWKGIQKKHYDDKVSKEAVLHHLKQLKAQMGKALKNTNKYCLYKDAVRDCMSMIDKKILKINQ